MRTRLLGFLIKVAVPFLNKFRKTPQWPFTLEELRLLPNESIGNDLAIFLDSQHLKLLPKYEVHDMLHVLLGYGVTPKEEVKLQGFMCGNGSATFGGKVLFIIGLVIKPEYAKSVLKEYKRGKTPQKLKSMTLVTWLWKKHLY